MIWFILAIAFSSMIVVTFKLFDRFKVDSIQAITLNYIIALLIGSQTLGMAGLREFVATEHSWVPFAILNGFLFIIVLLSFARSTKAVGIAITSVSSKTSVVLPVSMGFLLLHEGLGCLKMLGIVVALLAIYLSFRDKNAQHKPKQGLLFPLMLFFGTGLNDSVMKYAQVRYVEHQQTAYLMVVFGVALVFGFGLLAYNFVKGSHKLSWRSMAGGLVLGVLNWYSTLFMLKAMKVYDSSVLFPVFNSSIVTIAALLGFALFSEKLKPINWVGIALAIIAIGLIGLNSFV